MSSSAFDRVADAASQPVFAPTLVGGGTSLAGWLLSSQGLALMGLVIAVAGLLLQLVLGMRRDRREQIEHERRLRGL